MKRIFEVVREQAWLLVIVVVIMLTIYITFSIAAAAQSRSRAQTELAVRCARVMAVPVRVNGDGEMLCGIVVTPAALPTPAGMYGR